MAGILYRIGKVVGKVYKPSKPLGSKKTYVSTAIEIKYSRLWVRLAALGIDICAFIPLVVLHFWLFSNSRVLAMVSCILSPVLGLAYWVLMHWRFGQTFGKMVMKLKVTKRDRSAITLRQSLLRSCVDIAFYAFVIAGSLYALLSWPHDQWSTLSFWDRMGFFSQSLPDGNSFIQSLYFYWLLAELIVLLINRKRRALHDFIAGTVVISLRKPVNEPLN